MNHNAKHFLRTFLLLAVVLTAPPASRSQSGPHVNGDRLTEHMNAMAAIGKDPAGGYARVAYSDADRQGREYVMGLLRAVGLTPSIDAAGNITAGSALQQMRRGTAGDRPRIGPAGHRFARGFRTAGRQLR